MHSQNLVYVVTSDDPTWCKAAFSNVSRVFHTSDYLSSNNVSVPSYLFDLAVASLCQHAIFDYGTFGFWGAYLQVIVVIRYSWSPIAEC